MSGNFTLLDIAGLIAASAFLLFVIFFGILVFVIARFIRQMRISLKESTESALPSLVALQDTVHELNKQLRTFGGVADSVSEVAANVNSVVALGTATVVRPVVKVVSLFKTVASLGKSILPLPKSSRLGSPESLSLSKSSPRRGNRRRHAG